MSRAKKGMDDGRERKPRSDKGTIQATNRDMYCIAWIAEQYAARADQIRRLLSRFPDPDRPFKGRLIAETTTRDQIERWKKAGWIEYERVLAAQPGYAWVTRKGLQLVELDEEYTARKPAGTRLQHIYAVNQLRLFLDLKYAWKSERRYRWQQAQLTQGGKSKKGKKGGPIPDGVLTSREGDIAVEAEITPKKPADLEAKIASLVGAYPPDDYMKDSPIFARVWFYVPNARMEEAVKEACQSLEDKESVRVGLGVNDTLLG